MTASKDAPISTRERGSEGRPSIVIRSLKRCAERLVQVHTSGRYVGTIRGLSSASAYTRRLVGCAAMISARAAGSEANLRVLTMDRQNSPMAPVIQIARSNAAKSDMLRSTRVGAAANGTMSHSQYVSRASNQRRIQGRRVSTEKIAALATRLILTSVVLSSYSRAVQVWSTAK